MFTKSKTIAIAVLAVIFLFLWHHPDAYCKPMPEEEPPVKIEEFPFEDEGITVFAPKIWVVDKAQYTIVVARLPRKDAAEKQAKIKKLRYIINLDIHAIDPSGNKIAVQEITTDPDQFPPIKVEVKLKKTLFIWDGKKWEPAEKSVVKDVKAYFKNIDKFMKKSTGIKSLGQKMNNKLTFSVLRWPKDDRDMSDG